MSYVKESLVPGEKILLTARPHWRIFLMPTVFVLISCCTVFGSLLLRPGDLSPASVLASLLFLFGSYRLAQAVVVYLTTEFAVTNKRVMAKTGLWQRRSLELLLRQVESVRVDQRFMGRVLNYGDVVVTGSGGTWESFPNIASPLELRRRVNNQVAQAS